MKRQKVIEGKGVESQGKEERKGGGKEVNKRGEKTAADEG